MHCEAQKNILYIKKGPSLERFMPWCKHHRDLPVRQVWLNRVELKCDQTYYSERLFGFSAWVLLVAQKYPAYILPPVEYQDVSG